MLIRIAVLFLLLFFSCGYGNHGDEEPYLKEIGRIINENIKFMVDKYPLTPSSSGGAMMYKIEGLDFWFDSHSSQTIDELRKQVVFGVEDLLERINTNQIVRGHLAQFPFDENHIFYGIYFTGALIAEDSTDIRFCTLSKGHILYEAHINEIPLRTKVLHKETYQEAKRIVLGSQAGSDE